MMRKRINFYLVPFIIILLAILAVSSIVVTMPVSTSNVYKTTKPLVVLDAGHGGVDGGTQSKDGQILEKDINLDIVLTLRDMLLSYGYEVILTRSEDISIHDDTAQSIHEKKVSDLKNRLNLVAQYPNCILVSIHQNFFEQSQYHGAQFFYSKNNPNSKYLAECLKNSVIDQLQPENTRESKQAGKEIYLMWNTQVPAVLAECGFLSNAEEAEKLNTEEYRNQMAFSLMCGIVQYFQETGEVENGSKV